MKVKGNLTSGMLAGIVMLLLISQISLAQPQEPFANYRDYRDMLDNHWMTYDCWAHWNYILNTVDIMSYSQAPYFPVPNPYDMEMYKAWVDSNKYNQFELDRIYYWLCEDWDYGWIKDIMGVGWIYVLNSYIWSAASVAIIEPGRSAEAAFVVKECIECLRSPAAWKDYVIDEGYGDPMIDNVMWKGPLLIAEGLYALMTGDTATYASENRAIAENLYEIQQQNLNAPLGDGFSGGCCCEPNHWFPQCNSNGALGLILYDMNYGIDPLYGVYLGEEYFQNYFNFLQEYMSEPEVGEIYRQWHPYGPQQADKEYSGFSNAFTIINLKPFEPDFAQSVYDNTCERYLVDYPPGWGTFILEVPEFDAFGNLINAGPEAPGMFGEGALNIYHILAAAKIFEDQETFDGVNQFLTNMSLPYYREGEIRHEDTHENPEVGQLLNMLSGLWFFGKVHLGWETILAHDWSQNRDENGFMLNDPWPHNPPELKAQECTLFTSYPNPFNPETSLSFSFTKLANVSLRVYDVQGREVADIFNGWLLSGMHEFTFDASQLPSGVYFARLRADGINETRKLIVLK